MSGETCGPLCQCANRGQCQRLDKAEARRVMVEGAKHMLARYIAEGQTIDGLIPTLRDLIGDDEDPMVEAHRKMMQCYGAKSETQEHAPLVAPGEDPIMAAYLANVKRYGARQ